MAQEPMARYRPQEFKLGPDGHSDAELAEAAGRIASTIFDRVGTARMGADQSSVVDPTLKLREFQGLTVVVASIMPMVTSGNTNCPTIMIVKKAARIDPG